MTSIAAHEESARKTGRDTAFLETADRIGRRLCRDALWSGGRCNWLGWMMEPIGHQWVNCYRAQGCGLYAGTAGVALFLAYLERSTRDPLQREALEGAMRQAEEGLDTLDASTRLSFYSGLVGVAYAMALVGEITGREDMVRRGLDHAAGLRRDDPQGHLLDILAGSAGTIQALVHLARRYRRNDLVDIAARHGEHLIGQAHRSDAGWSWDTMKIDRQRDLLGYSHGTAGIALALLELHEATGADRYRHAALEALRYERRHFDSARDNWPDLRDWVNPGGRGDEAFMMAWCHGAPGIGLSRLRVRQLLGAGPEVDAEIAAALRSTRASLQAPPYPGHGNYSLCHGSGGNADLLIVADDLGLGFDDRILAEDVGRKGIEAFEGTESPWPCGVQNAGETPNLMLGLAGIGYFYLRLHDSRRVPSILVLIDQDG